MPVFILPDMTGTDAVAKPLRIDLLNTLKHFKKPRPAGNAICFQGRRNSQTDRFLRPAFIRNHQIGGQRIELALNAFDRSIKAFQVDRNISPGLNHGGKLLSLAAGCPDSGGIFTDH